MQRGKTSTIRADLHQIGSIDLTDLDILSKSYGRDFLPYPFMLTRPSRFSTRNEYVNYAIIRAGPLQPRRSADLPTVGGVLCPRRHPR